MDSRAIVINDETNLTTSSDQTKENNTLSTMKKAVVAGAAAGAAGGFVSAFLGGAASAICSSFFPPTDIVPCLVTGAVSGGIPGTIMGSFTGCFIADTDYKIGWIVACGTTLVSVCTGVAISQVTTDILTPEHNDALYLRGVVAMGSLIASTGGGAMVNGVLCSVAAGAANKLTSCCSILFSQKKSSVQLEQALKSTPRPGQI